MSSDISSVSGGGGVAPSVLQIKTRHLVRPPTPETMITDRPNDPDISIFCEKCHEFISVRATQEHRNFHSALTVLGYTGKEQPESVKGLLKKRQELMVALNKKSNPDRPVSLYRLQKINEAFELVKSHLEETYEELIHSKENFIYDCQGISLNCSAPCVRAVGICSNDNSRWKSKMEDTRVFQDYYGNDVNKCFFGIYDGYNGRFAADVAANDLHHVFLNELQKVDDKVSCTCAVNLADKNDLTDYQLERGSPIVRSDSIRHILHEESVNIIQQIMHTCESNLMKISNDDSQLSQRDRPMRKKKNKNPEYEKVSQAYHNTYLYLDQYLSYGINETSLVRWSGCSALSLLISSEEHVGVEDGKDGNKVGNKDKDIPNDNEATEEKKDGEKETEEGEEGEKGSASEDPEKETKEDDALLEELGVLHIANAGNTQAVLCRAGKAYRLSKDHIPGNQQERSRVEKTGASIHAGGPNGRVNGILDTTRGLGNYGDPQLKKAVIPDPYTTSIKIDQHAEFIVMASYGLWDVLTDEEVISLVKQTLAIRQSRTEAENVPDGFCGYGLSDNTTYGEDFLGESYATGLGTSYDQAGFDNTVSSVIDIDAAEGDEANVQKKQFRNPLQSLKEDADDEDDGDDDANSKSQINWNEPLTDKDTDDHQKTTSDEGNNQKKSIRVKGVVVDAKAESENETVSDMKNYKEEFNDNASMKTDFESLISALCDDGNEADVETLTELHTFYAKSRLSDGRSIVDKKEEYRLTAEMISERLVQSALLAGSRDNITVMVILLHGCQL
nr:protein phosphatase 2C-like domain-containing protein 1 [Lytechinus pictus]